MRATLAPVARARSAPRSLTMAVASPAAKYRTSSRASAESATTRKPVGSPAGGTASDRYSERWEMRAGVARLISWARTAARTRSGSASHPLGTSAATGPRSVSKTRTLPTTSGGRPSTAAMRSADRNRSRTGSISCWTSRSTRWLWTSTLVRMAAVWQARRAGHPSSVVRGTHPVGECAGDARRPVGVRPRRFGRVALAGAALSADLLVELPPVALLGGVAALLPADLADLAEEVRPVALLGRQTTFAPGLGSGHPLALATVVLGHVGTPPSIGRSRGTLPYLPQVPRKATPERGQNLRSGFHAARSIRTAHRLKVRTQSCRRSTNDGDLRPPASHGRDGRQRPPPQGGGGAVRARGWRPHCGGPAHARGQRHRDVRVRAPAPAQGRRLRRHARGRLRLHALRRRAVPGERLPPAGGRRARHPQGPGGGADVRGAHAAPGGADPGRRPAGPGARDRSDGDRQDDHDRVGRRAREPDPAGAHRHDR